MPDGISRVLVTISASVHNARTSDYHKRPLPSPIFYLLPPLAPLSSLPSLSLPFLFSLFSPPRPAFHVPLTPSLTILCVSLGTGAPVQGVGASAAGLRKCRHAGLHSGAQSSVISPRGPGQEHSVPAWQAALLGATPGVA